VDLLPAKIDQLADARAQSRGTRDRMPSGYLVRENPWLQLQQRHFSVRHLFCSIRGNTMVLRPARCKFVKDRGGVIQ
jgi:hypothetical protein